MVVSAILPFLCGDALLKMAGNKSHGIFSVRFFEMTSLPCHSSLLVAASNQGTHCSVWVFVSDCLDSFKRLGFRNIFDVPVCN